MNKGPGGRFDSRVCHCKDGIPVTLTRQQWEEHILVGHPNMARHLEALKQTIADPDYILQSDRHADTRLLYRLGVTEGQFSGLYVARQC